MLFLHIHNTNYVATIFFHYRHALIIVLVYRSTHIYGEFPHLQCKQLHRVSHFNPIRIALTTFPFIIGRFDIVGQSHQILHVAVIAAIYLHFYGICCLFHNVIQTEQCILPIKSKLGITDLSISS